MDDTPEGEDIKVAVRRLQMGAGRRFIGYEGRTIEVLAKGGNTGKLFRHKMLGQTGKCDKVVVLRGTHLNSTVMNDDGANS